MDEIDWTFWLIPQRILVVLGALFCWHRLSYMRRHVNDSQKSPHQTESDDDNSVCYGSGPSNATTGVTATTLSPERRDQVDEFRTEPGRYEIGDERGRGGLGRVLAGEDTHLKRRVAVKELLEPGAVHEARFVREVMITARLQHPAIVPVYDLKRHANGRPYYCMKMVEGKTLKDVIAGCDGIRERLAIVSHVLTIAEAIAYAHSERIIHRDLKPSNCMVGAFGEVVVIDWGLAKDLSAPHDDYDHIAGPFRVAPGSPALTNTGSVIGTPAYMPPEQARGEAVSERADVYSLGAILYHVLTGQAPYSGGDSRKIVQNVRSTSPKAVESFDGVPPDLAAIVNKAMARDAADRYPNAKQFADDLRAFTSGQLVAAHEYSTSQLVKRWVAQHRAPMAVGVTAAMVLLLVGSYSVKKVVSARDEQARQRIVAEDQRTRAEDERNKLVLKQSEFQLERDATTAFAWLKRYPSSGAQQDRVREVAWEAIDRGVAETVLEPHDAAITDVEISADDRWIAASSPGQRITIWDRENSKLRRLEVLGKAVPQAMVFAPNSPDLILATESGSVVRYDHANDRTTQFSGKNRPYSALDVSPSGQAVAAGTSDGTLVLWREGARNSRIIGTSSGRIFSVRFADEYTVVAGYQNGKLLIANAHDGKSSPAIIAAHRGTMYALTQLGDTIATAGSDNAARLWNVRTGKLEQTLAAEQPLFDVHLYANRTKAVTAGLDGSVRIWDLATNQGRLVGKQQEKEMMSELVGASTDDYLASINHVGQLVIWRESGRQQSLSTGGQVGLTAIKISPSANLIATGSADGHVALWKRPAVQVRTLLGHTNQVLEAVQSADGALLLTGSADGTARTWDLSTGESETFSHPNGGAVSYVGFLSNDRLFSRTRESICIWNMKTHEHSILHTSATGYMISMSRNSDTIAIADTRSVLVWDANDSTQLIRRAELPDEVHSIRLTPDKTHVVVLSRSGNMSLLDVASGAVVPFEGKLTGEPNTVRISPNGQLVLAGATSGELRSWSLPNKVSRLIATNPTEIQEVNFVGDESAVFVDRTGRVVFVALATAATHILGQWNGVRDLAVSDDDGAVAVGLSDHTVRVMNLTTGIPTTLVGHEQQIVTTHWLRGGDKLLSADESGTMRISTILPRTAPPRDFTLWLSVITSAVITDDTRALTPLNNPTLKDNAK